MRHASATLRAKLAEAFPDRALEDPAAIFAATRALKDSKAYKKAGDDALPLS